MTSLKSLAPVILVSLFGGCVAPHPLSTEEKLERRQDLNNWVKCVEEQEIHEIKQDATGEPKTRPPSCD